MVSFLFRLSNKLKPSQRNYNASHDENITNKIISLKHILIEQLATDDYKNCLLILSEVQDTFTMDAFKLQCKIMLTTRNKEVCYNYNYILFMPFLFV